MNPVSKLLPVVIAAFLLSSCTVHPKPVAGPLSGLKITLDPGHGNTSAYDRFRASPSGEREEHINLRVAVMLRDLLGNAGAEVIMTRDTDTDVNLGGRAAIAVINESDFFIAIHHNGSLNDTTLDFPLVYYWGAASENPASIDLANLVVEKMLGKMTFENTAGAGVFSDFLIYSKGTAVLRNSYPHLPGIIGEAGYFTNSASDMRMRDKSFNRLEAESYFEAILEYYSKGIPKIRLIQPEIGEPLDDRKPTVLFELTDGLGGHEFIGKTMTVKVDGEAVPHSWDPGSGTLTVIPDIADRELISIQVYGRNKMGNALHPRQIDFLTSSGKSKRWEGKWSDAFEKGEEIRRRLVNSKPAEVDSLKYMSDLNEAIHWFARSIELQAHHPKSSRAEYNIALLYRLMYEHSGEIEAEEETLKYLTRVVEYYPGSKEASLARKVLNEAD